MRRLTAIIERENNGLVALCPRTRYRQWRLVPWAGTRQSRGGAHAVLRDCRPVRSSSSLSRRRVRDAFV